MPCYVIAHIDVTNPEGFGAYQQKVPGVIAQYGGEYLVRGGHATDMENEMPHPRHVVVRWPDRAAAERFYRSPEYQEILPLRLDNSEGVLTIVDGVEP